VPVGIDLFGFFMSVHLRAVSTVSNGRSGSDAVWGVFRGFSMLQPRFHLHLPLDDVKPSLPTSVASRGHGVTSTGSRPLPPEALTLLFAYRDQQQVGPAILSSWAFALTFWAVSSLRQANAQHIAFFGTFSAGGKDFLLSRAGLSPPPHPSRLATPRTAPGHCGRAQGGNERDKGGGSRSLLSH
jgi:hypothetical protein